MVSEVLGGSLITRCRAVSVVKHQTVLEMDGELYSERMVFMHCVVEDAPSGFTAADVTSAQHHGGYSQCKIAVMYDFVTQNRFFSNALHILMPR